MKTVYDKGLLPSVALFGRNCYMHLDDLEVYGLYNLPLVDIFIDPFPMVASGFHYWMCYR